MKKFWLMPVVVLVLMACGEQKQSAVLSESERLNQWFAERYEEELQFSPITLTMLGRKDLYDQIDDLSEQAEAEQLEWKRQTVATMEQEFDYDALTPEAKTSFDIWKYQYEQATSGQPYRNHGYIFEQMGGLQSELPNFLLNFHRVDNEQDLEAYISRIGAVASAIDQALVRAKAAAGQGIRPPRFAFDGAIDQSQKLLLGLPFEAGAADDAPLWDGAKSKVDALRDSGAIDEAQARAYRERAKTALLGSFQPSYSALIQWLKADRENAPEMAHGAGSLPEGEAYYNYRLGLQTTTTLSANEVHQIGLREVDRLRAEIEAIKTELGFAGSLQDFFAFVRTDPQFYFADTDAGRRGYLDGATAYIAFIKEKLPDYFGLLPKADLIMKRVEAFREQDGAAQHYYSGTPDGSRPGIYYAHLSDMSAMPKNQMEVIAYHEGLPGHHMQISIAQELENIPMFRTQASFTAYVEGWALYSEILAGEMGAYEDPYSRVGQLSSEIWRAIRLVVDTGLHSKGWSEDQAVQYFLANSPEPKESVVAEVRRYLVWPGQATSYKIGMMKILELREAAKKTLGDKFDIRAYHDTVLGGGAMPLSLLERRVQGWVDSLR